MKWQKNLSKNTILTWSWPHCPLVIFFLGRSCQLFLARLSPFVFLLITVFHLLMSSLNLLSFHFHFLSSLSSRSCCATLPCMHGPPMFSFPFLLLSRGSGGVFLFKLIISHLELPWDLQPRQTAIRQTFQLVEKILNSQSHLFRRDSERLRFSPVYTPEHVDILSPVSFVLTKGRGGTWEGTKCSFILNLESYFSGAHANKFHPRWILRDSESEKKCCSEGCFFSQADGNEVRGGLVP